MNKAVTQFKSKAAKKKNSIYDSVFKSSMFVSIAIAVVFVASLVIFVIQAGSGAFSHPDAAGNPGANWGYFITGNYYDGATYFASGFMLINQLWTTFLAILIAAPIGILTALFITRLAPRPIKVMLLFAVTMLAAIPSVIFGAFGTKWIDGAIQGIWDTVPGITLSIVLTLTMMVLPTITLITTSALNSVDKKMEDSSLALGATRSQTSMFVTLKAATPGIMVAIILSIGRVMGESSAVSMVSRPSNYSGEMGLFEQIRLLTATMLNGRTEMAPGSLNEAMMMAQGALLIVSIFAIFGVMKYAENRADINSIAKRQQKKAAMDNAVIQRYKEVGLDAMLFNEKRRYKKLMRKRAFIEKENKKAAIAYENNTKFSIMNSSIKKSVGNGDLYKKTTSRFMGGMTGFFSMFGVLFFGAIVVFLLVYGTQALTWEYLSTANSTGLAIPFFNTVMSLLITLGIALPLGITGGIFFAEYTKKGGGTHKVLGTFFDLLSGVPSIIFGMVGYVVISQITGNIGMLTISLTMVFMILPTIIRTTENALNSVYAKLKEGSLALGATKSRTAIRVSIPKAMPEIISGAFLGAGRVVGESASIIFILGTLPGSGPSDLLTPGAPGTTLATEIYRLTKMEHVEWDKVAAIGLVLVGMILYLTGIGNQLQNKKYRMSLLMLGGFAGATAGIMTGNFGVFIASIAIGAGVPVVKSTFNLINNRYGLVDLDKYKIAISKAFKSTRKGA